MEPAMWWKACRLDHSAEFAWRAHQLCGERGLAGEADAVLGEYGYRVEDLEDLERRIPMAIVFRLMEMLTRDDELVGLALAQRDYDNLPMCVGRTAATLDAGYMSAYGLRALATAPSMRVAFEDTPAAQVVRARFETEDVAGMPAVIGRQFIDWWWAGVVHVGRRWTGVSWSPLEVRFTYSRPADIRPLEDFFGCPLSFSSHENVLVHDKRALALPLLAADPALHRNLRRYAEGLHARLPTPSLDNQVVELLSLVLDRGAGVADIARALGLSERSLQRYLSRSGLSFKSLLETARRREAERLLTATDHTVMQIADALGYSTARSFSRAFHRWYGTSPRAFRARSAGSS